MELTEYLRSLRRSWAVILGCVLLLGAVGALSGSSGESHPRKFHAVQTLVREGPPVNARPGQGAGAGTGRTTTSQDSAATLVATIVSGEVPARVAKRLGFDGAPDELAATVKVTYDEQAKKLSISTRSQEAKRAVEVVNGFTEEFLAFSAEEAAAAQEAARVRTSEQVDRLQERARAAGERLAAAPETEKPLLEAAQKAVITQLTVALVRLEQLAAEEPAPGWRTTQTVRAVQMEPALLSSPEGRAAGGGALGALFGVGIVLLAHRLKPRIRTKRAAESAFNLPVLVEIPEPDPRLSKSFAIATVSDPGSQIAESYRMLRAVVLRAPITIAGRRPERRNDQTERRVVLVTSPAVKDGKTAAVANLAACLAEMGQSVLVMSCDLRAPQIHRYYGVSAAPGICDVVAGRPGAPTLTDVVQSTSVPGVRVVATGQVTANPAELLAGVCRLITTARSLADVILLDTPPLLTANDAADLVTVADAVLVMCRGDSTAPATAARTTELLFRIAAPVLGVALFTGSSAVPLRSGSRHWETLLRRAPSPPGQVRKKTSGGVHSRSPTPRVEVPPSWPDGRAEPNKVDEELRESNQAPRS